MWNVEINSAMETIDQENSEDQLGIAMDVANNNDYQLSVT